MNQRKSGKKKLSWLAVALTVLLSLNTVGFIWPKVLHAAGITHNLSSGRLNISAGDGDYTITGSATGGTANYAVVTVQSGYTGTITLENASIRLTTANAGAVAIQSGASPTIKLVGTNNLQGGANRAGLSVPAGAMVTIEGEGALSATGGISAAGIGGDGVSIVGSNGADGMDATTTSSATSGVAGGDGSPGGASGNIIIKSGTITAKGGSYAADIGGGAGANGGNGGNGGATIYTNRSGTGGNGGRGGNGGNGGNFVMLGGTVNTTGIIPIGGGKGGNGGTGGKGGDYHSRSTPGTGGNGGYAGNNGSTGNIIILGGKLKEGVAVVQTSGATGGVGGIGGNNSVGYSGTTRPATAPGAIGAVYILTDNTKATFYDTGLIENKIRTVDYRSGIDIYADLSSNTKIASVLRECGIDPTKIPIGKTGGTEGTTSAYMRRGFYSNQSNAIVFSTDDLTADGQMGYLPETRTAAQLRAYSDIAMGTGQTLRYDGNGYNGEELPKAITCKPGSSVKLAEAIERLGYEFKGWNLSADGTGTAYTAGETITYPATGAMVLYAQWEAKPFTLTFDANGGTGDIPAQTHSYDAVIQLPNGSGFSNAQAVFIGWNTQADGSGSAYSAGVDYTMGLDATLYAQWGTASQYQLKYNGNGQTQGIDFSQTVSPGDTVAIQGQGALGKDGYTFLGWSTTPGGGVVYMAGDLVTVTEDMELFAVWEAAAIQSYTLAYNGNGQTAGSMKNETVPYNTTVTIKDKGTLVKNGYTFAGWGMDKNGGVAYRPGDSFTMPDGDVRLYAIWVANELYSVRFIANGGTAVTTLEGVRYGDLLPNPSTARLGHTFTGWYINPALTKAWDFAVDRAEGDLLLYAGWEINSYNLRYNGNGQTSGSMNNEVVPYNAQVYLKNKGTLVKTGYVFSGWSLSANGPAQYQPGDIYTMKAEDIRFYAVWEPDVGGAYTVWFETNGGSFVADLEGVAQGTKITAPESEKIGYRFTGWFTDRTLATKWDFDNHVVTNNMTLYAGWEAVTFELKYNGNGHNTGSAQNVKDVPYGTELVIKGQDSLVKYGYTFGGWSYSPAGEVDFVPGDRIIITEETKLYAVWKAESYTLRYNGNGHNTGSAQNVENVPYGTELVIKGQDSLVKYGYTFGGWSYSPAGEVDFVPGDRITITEETKLYAVWQ